MTEQSTTNPIWLGDYLLRKDEAKYLSGDLAARYEVKKKESGFVLAINGDWGMGKTFMMDRWSKELELAGHPIVRFNSWENDFTAEPLVAFIAEIDKSLKPFFEKIPVVQRLQEEWLKKAKAVLIPTLKVAGIAALKYGTGMGYEKVQEFFTSDIDNDGGGNDDNDGSDENTDFDAKALQEKLSKVVEEKLKEHNNTRDAIIGFKVKFAAIISQIEKEGIQLPIYVFVDELDRCRPDYAIKLLEGIKHLFGIPGLYFVIATNISELAHSILADYGAGFSSERYLKRFFDMEYSLPEPRGDNFCTELMAPLAQLSGLSIITGFEQIFTGNELPLKGLPYIFLRYAEAFELTLRDQHQAARILETALISLKSKKIHIHFLIFLSVVYQKSSTVYKAMASSYSISEHTNFQSILPKNGKGLFKYRTFDGEDHAQKSVSCVDIAQAYFSYLHDRDPSVRHIASHDFPKNMIRDLYVSGIKPEHLKTYVEIVRRAGNFIE